MNKEQKQKQKLLTARESELAKNEENLALQEESYSKSLNKLIKLQNWNNKRVDDFINNFPELASQINNMVENISDDMKPFLEIEKEINQVLKKREETLKEREILLLKRNELMRNFSDKLVSIKQKILNQEQELSKAMNGLLTEINAQKRRELRITVDLPVSLNSEHTLLKGNIENISSSGIFLRTEQLLPVNRTVEINFLLPDKTSFIATGKVAWVRKGNNKIQHGIGIAFTQITSDQLTKLQKILKTYRV